MLLSTCQVSIPACPRLQLPPKMRTRGRSLQLLELREELLLKILDCMTTTEGRGLLLCCRRLSDLARPSVFQKRQKEARYYLYFRSSGFATIQGLAAIWSQHQPFRRLRGLW